MELLKNNKEMLVIPEITMDMLVITEITADMLVIPDGVITELFLTEI
jgi:hypothetical protein